MPSPVKWYGTDFFLTALKKFVPVELTDAMTEGFGYISTARATLKEWRKVLEVVFSIASAFSLKNLNPIASLFNLLNQLFAKLIQDFLTTGAQAILITPFNRANKRTQNIFSAVGIPDLTRTTSQYEAQIKTVDEAISGLQSEELSIYAKPGMLVENGERIGAIRTDLERLRKKRAACILGSKLTGAGDKAYNSLVEYSDRPEMTIPVMTPVEAFEELKASFFNRKDVYRPQWSTSTTVVGFGLLLVSGSGDTGAIADTLNSWNIFKDLLDEASGRDLRESLDKFSKISEQYKEDLIRSGLIPENSQNKTFADLTSEALGTLSPTQQADYAAMQARYGVTTRGAYRRQQLSSVTQNDLSISTGAQSSGNVGPGQWYTDRFVTADGETYMFHYETEADYESVRQRLLRSNYAGLIDQMSWGAWNETSSDTEASQHFTREELSSEAPIIWTPLDGVKLDVEAKKKFAMPELDLSQLRWHGLNVSNITYLREVVTNLIAFSNILGSAIQGTGDATMSLIRTLFTKIERIIESIEKILLSIENLQKITATLPGMYAFFISPQTGGVDAMIASLSTFKDDPSASNPDPDIFGNRVTPIVQQLTSPFTIMFFAAAGGLSAAYYDDLFRQINDAITTAQISYRTSGAIELEPTLSNDQIVPPGDVDFRVLSEGENTHFSYELIHRTTNLVVASKDPSTAVGNTQSITEDNISLRLSVRNSPLDLQADKSAYTLRVQTFKIPYADNVQSTIAREFQFYVQENAEAWPLTFLLNGIQGSFSSSAETTPKLALLPLDYFTKLVSVTVPTDIATELNVVSGSEQPRLVYTNSLTPYVKYAYTLSRTSMDETVTPVVSGEKDEVYSDTQRTGTKKSTRKINLSQTGVAGLYELSITAESRAGATTSATWKFITSSRISEPVFELDDDYDLSDILTTTYTGPVRLYIPRSTTPTRGTLGIEGGIGTIDLGPLVDQAYVVGGNGTIGATAETGDYILDVGGIYGGLHISKDANDIITVTELNRLKNIIYVPQFPAKITLSSSLGEAIKYFWDGVWQYSVLPITLEVPEEITFSCSLQKSGSWENLLQVWVRIRANSKGVC